jgi:hypothetical protein
MPNCPADGAVSVKEGLAGVLSNARHQGMGHCEIIAGHARRSCRSGRGW